MNFMSCCSRLNHKKVSWIQRGFEGLFCRKDQNLVRGGQFWTIRFGFQGSTRPYLRCLPCNLRFLPCNSDYRGEIRIILLRISPESCLRGSTGKGSILFGDRYDWTTGDHAKDMDGGSTVSYLTRHPSRPLVYVFFFLKVWKQKGF